MSVTIKLAPDVAQQLREAGDESGETGNVADRALAVKRVADELGMTLTPLHPNVDDPELSTYFLAEPTAPAPADSGTGATNDGEAAATLYALEGVEAAYPSPNAQPAS
jgi:hypothetical protein